MKRLTKEEFESTDSMNAHDDKILEDIISNYIKSQRHMVVYWMGVALDSVMRFMPTNTIATTVAHIYQLTKDSHPAVAERLLHDLRIPLDDMDFTENLRVPKSILALQDKILAAISAL